MISYISYIVTADSKEGNWSCYKIRWTVLASHWQVATYTSQGWPHWWVSTYCQIVLPVLLFSVNPSHTSVVIVTRGEECATIYPWMGQLPLLIHMEDVVNLDLVTRMMIHWMRMLSSVSEIITLQNVLRSFGGDDLWNRPNLRGEHDPMWWGMEAIFDQFVVGHPRTTDFHFYMRIHCLGMPEIHHSLRWLSTRSWWEQV